MGKTQTLFLTYNDLPGGVFKSQVVEVIQNLNSLTSKSIYLVSIISPRSFLKNKRNIKETYPYAIVLPSIAPLKFFKLNKLFLLYLKWKYQNLNKIICRGPLATNLALGIFKKEKIIYDGRGAITAEQNEYGVFSGSGIENRLFEFEKNAVILSGFRIAVTHKLVEYWKKEFNYSSNNHVVIPCTVSQKKEITTLPSNVELFVNSNKNKTFFCFVGGKGKWQGTDLIAKFLKIQFENNDNYAAILLCPQTEEINQIITQYPDKILNTLVKPIEVHPILELCDYGILLRHPTVTNMVASPVKIAEYLYAGLKVIISPQIGDYSEFILQNNCGYIYQDGDILDINKLDTVERKKNNQLAQNFFSKSSEKHVKSYKKILEF